MKINEEILRELGFEKVKIDEYDLLRYSTNIATLYLDGLIEESRYCIIYEKIDDEYNELGRCYNISELLEKIISINNLKALELGKKLKQEEIRVVLGINK